MEKEVAIGTTVVPIILAIRTTVVPIIFAIRKGVLLKRGTENGTEWKTEWIGKYAMPYTYTCVKHIYTIFVLISRLSHWQCRCAIYSP